MSVELLPSHLAPRVIKVNVFAAPQTSLVAKGVWLEDAEAADPLLCRPREPMPWARRQLGKME